MISVLVSLLIYQPNNEVFKYCGRDYRTGYFILQIELDLLRTLPNNKHYESIESEGILKLRRILLAFSEHNQCIGYCQV